MRRALSAALALVLAALLAPATAAAAPITYCVQKPDCTGDHSKTTLTQALSAAAGNAGGDRIELGPVEFSEAATDAAGNQVDIVGSGTGTVLTAPSGTNVTVLMLSEPSSTLSNLAIHIPDGNTNIGLVLSGGVADAVHVSAPDTAMGPQGVYMGMATMTGPAFRNGSVVLPVGGNTTGTAISNTGTATIEDVSVQAPNGISNLTQAKVRRAHVVATHGIESGDFINGGSNNQLLVEDSTVSLVTSGATGSAPYGIEAFAGDMFVPATSSVTVHHATLIGNGLQDSLGLIATAGAPGGPAADSSLTADNSIVRGFKTSLTRFAGGSNEANLTIDWSDYEPTVSDQGTGTLTQGDHKLDVDPGLRDTTVNPPNLRLRGDSPLIDAGDPAGLAMNESTTDVDGKARTAGGRSDIGAAEYQGKPAATVTAAPNPAKVGQAVTFDATGSTSPESSVAGYTWDLDGNGSFETDTGPMPTAQHTYAAPGSVAVKVHVSALDGGAADAGVTLQVAAGPDATAPLVTKFKLRKLKRFTWSLSEPAKVKITIARKKGRKFKRAGKALRKQGVRGANSLKLKRKLKRGRYRATIVATDAAGNKSKPKRAKFRVRKPKRRR